MALILGIDGGGTKTKVEIWDSEKGCLKQMLFGTSNINQLGPDHFRSLIEKIGSNINLMYGMIDVAILGIPAYGESKRTNKIVNSIIYQYICSKEIHIFNDVEVGHFGSLECKDGINVVSGTGSIALGVFQGKKIRCGGWGEIIGDEGSSYKIGLQTLQTLSKQIDNRNPKTVLYDLLSEDYNLNEMSNVIDYVYNSDNRRSRIASLSQTTYIAANLGCEQSQLIFEDAAKELCLHVTTIIDMIEPGSTEEILVSYSGGTFNAHNYFLEVFIKLLSQIENVNLITPRYSPIHGAILKGFEILNLKPNKIFKYKNI